MNVFEEFDLLAGNDGTTGFLVLGEERSLLDLLLWLERKKIDPSQVTLSGPSYIVEWSIE